MRIYLKSISQKRPSGLVISLFFISLFFHIVFPLLLSLSSLRYKRIKPVHDVYNVSLVTVPKVIKKVVKKIDSSSVVKNKKKVQSKRVKKVEKKIDQPKKVEIKKSSVVKEVVKIKEVSPSVKKPVKSLLKNNDKQSNKQEEQSKQDKDFFKDFFDKLDEVVVPDIIESSLDAQLQIKEISDEFNKTVLSEVKNDDHKEKQEFVTADVDKNKTGYSKRKKKIPPSRVNVESGFNYPYYERLIHDKLNNRFQPPPVSKEISVSIIFIIKRSGVVESVVIKTKSGNVYFDQAAERTVYKASPFPPLPDDYRKGEVTVIYNFTNKVRS